MFGSACNNAQNERRNQMNRGKTRLQSWVGALPALILLFAPLSVSGYEINDKWSINGVLAGAVQAQQISEPGDDEDDTRAGLAIQPEVSFTPNDSDEFFFKAGFGAGNGLNGVSPFAFSPWAADLEDDVKDINGRNRDYLLTAWYKHTFQWNGNKSLSLTGGLIDATDYLDENAFSNDEYTQFMNQALVNGPNGFLPSYDGGGAAEIAWGNVSFKGVFMAIGENDDGSSYRFYGVQLGYRLETPMGEGNYRVIYDTTSKDFPDPESAGRERLRCVLISFDQRFGDILGGWIRFGRQDDRALIACKNLYSGGINISGKWWGRQQDQIGLGYAYLEGGNTGLDSSHVAEGYVRFGLNEFFALTLDIQYMKDSFEDQDDPHGLIYGLRMVSEF
jgi:porin